MIQPTYLSSLEVHANKKPSLSWQDLLWKQREVSVAHLVLSWDAKKKEEKDGSCFRFQAGQEEAGLKLFSNHFDTSSYFGSDHLPTSSGWKMVPKKTTKGIVWLGPSWKRNFDANYLYHTIILYHNWFNHLYLVGSTHLKKIWSSNWIISPNRIVSTQVVVVWLWILEEQHSSGFARLRSTIDQIKPRLSIGQKSKLNRLRNGLSHWLSHKPPQLKFP